MWRYFARPEEPAKLWAISIPVGRSLVWWSGVLGNKGRQYSAEVDDLFAAVESYNKRIRAKRKEGFVEGPPAEWHRGYRAPDGDVSEVVEFHDDACTLPKRRFFASSDAVVEGPEWVYREDGSVHCIVERVRSKANGWRHEFNAEGQPIESIQCLDDLNSGLHYIYNPDGLIDKMGLVRGDEYLWRARFSSKGLLRADCEKAEALSGFGYDTFAPPLPAWQLTHPGATQQTTSQASHTSQERATPTDVVKPTPKTTSVGTSKPKDTDEPMPKEPQLSEEMGGDVAELRELLQAQPTRKGWLQVCDWIVQSWKEHPAETAELYFPYIREHIAGGRWSASLRMAPLDWLPRMVEGELPYDCLSVVSALSLVPYFNKWRNEEERKPFRLWLSNMPKDCGALEGLHCNYRDRVAKRAKADFPHILSEDLEAALKSPMCRDLRVLDASVEEFWSDIYSPSQDDVLGYLYLHDLLGALQAPALEVLLLHGQVGGESMCVDRVTASQWKKLAQLEVLDLSGALPMSGHLSRLSKSLPAIRKLRLLESDSAKETLGGSWEDLGEECQENLDRYWSVYSFNWSDFQVSKKGLKDLLNHPTLEFVLTPSFSLYNESLASIYNTAQSERPELQIHKSAYGLDNKDEKLFTWEGYFSR